jgi:hypothetical protein
MTGQGHSGMTGGSERSDVGRPREGPRSSLGKNGPKNLRWALIAAPTHALKLPAARTALIAPPTGWSAEGGRIGRVEVARETRYGHMVLAADRRWPCTGEIQTILCLVTAPLDSIALVLPAISELEPNETETELPTTDLGGAP